MFLRGLVRLDNVLLIHILVDHGVGTEPGQSYWSGVHWLHYVPSNLIDRLVIWPFESFKLTTANDIDPW